MKKRPSLKKKLAQYSILASPILALANLADAQIVYTDIIPDTVLNLPGEPYALDLNNDGFADFTFKARPWRRLTDFAIVNPYPSTSQNQNAIAGMLGGAEAAAYPFALNGGQQIDANLNWIAMADIAPILNQYPSLDYPETWQVLAWHYLDQSNSTFVGGYWNDQSDKYLPLRLIDEGNTYYGWARLTVPYTALPFIIKDYAFNTDPDKQIVAGDTTGAIEGIGEAADALNAISLFPNPNSGEFTVQIKPNEFHDPVLSLINSLGMKVFEKKLSSGSNLFTENPDLRNLPKGMYTVRVQSGEKVAEKKLVIE